MVEIIKAVDVDCRKNSDLIGEKSIIIKHERLAALRRYFRIKYGKEVLFTYKEIKLYGKE